MREELAHESVGQASWPMSDLGRPLPDYLFLQPLFAGRELDLTVR